MINVTMYSKQECHLCDQALQYLEDLQSIVPHQLEVIEIDDNTELQKKYAIDIPVIEVGPYRLKSPFSAQDLEITLRAAAEREKNSYHSAQVSSSNQPLTTLDIVVSPKEVTKGGTADISVDVHNADNSPYYGQVFFEVVEGSGSFTPNPVDAKDSEASAIFTAVDSGTVRVRVRATGTYYGEITEEAAIRVK